MGREGGGEEGMVMNEYMIFSLQTTYLSLSFSVLSFYLYCLSILNDRVFSCMGTIKYTPVGFHKLGFAK